MRGDIMALNSGRKRGNRAQERTMSIYRGLKGQFPIVAIYYATPFQDGKGIDIIVVLEICGTNVLVPMQIKSSSEHAREYKRKYRVYVEKYHVFVFVVNNKKTDDFLEEKFSTALQHIIDCGIRYDDFFKMIEKFATPEQKQEIEDARRFSNLVPRIPSKRKDPFYRPSVQVAMYH